MKTPTWFASAIAFLPALLFAAEAPVSIAEHGRDVELSNGLVTITIDPAAAEITSAKFNDHEVVSRTGRHKNIYFSRDGGADYENVSHCVGSITTRTDDTIDYCCRHTYDPARDKHAWDVDVHVVVRRGVPGVYLYAVTSHPAEYANLSVGEWRMVWSTPEDRADFLDTIFVDDVRHWPIPSPADFAHAEAVPGAPKEVAKLTSGPWKDRLDCKYMYAASYFDRRCWGFADDAKHLGGWVVLPSCEFFNDGPNKQDLTAAVGTTLLHLNMNHYDGTGFTIPSGRAWDKCYGPWLIYFNHQPSAVACWKDAQDRVAVESAQWPYEWVTEKSYARADRGGVIGRLVLRDPLEPALTAAGAWVGLAPAADRPGADFQFSASGYQFWTRADADGAFEIDHVRSGPYVLYAYTSGVIGQFAYGNVNIPPNHALMLGKLDWTFPDRKLLWEIGTPDRSAAEFGHGRDYYLPLMYKRLQTEVPNPLDFTVGKSDPAKDWYYSQTTHRDGDRLVPAVWRVHFDLPDVPTGSTTLTLAIAGADRARLSVAVNDQPAADVPIRIQGGNGLIREAVHTKYSVSELTIPAGQLRQGPNTISLTQKNTADPAYIMYDCLRLTSP